MKLLIVLASLTVAFCNEIPVDEVKTVDIVPSKYASFILNEDIAQLSDGINDIQLNSFHQNGVAKYDLPMPIKSNELQEQIESPNVFGQDAGDGLFVEDIENVIGELPEEDSQESDDPAMGDGDENNSNNDVVDMENMLKLVIDTPELKEVEKELENIIIGGKPDASEIIEETFEETQIVNGELFKNDLVSDAANNADEGFIAKLSSWVSFRLLP